jgi:hypothetical protein
VKPIPRVKASKYKGLGDVVHAIAQPIAAVSDSILRTNFKNCGGCKQRQQQLNELVPFGKVLN